MKSIDFYTYVQGSALILTALLLLTDGKAAVLTTQEHTLEQDTICEDTDERCIGWAQDGWCDRSTTFMNANCTKSCDKCIGQCTTGVPIGSGCYSTHGESRDNMKTWDAALVDCQALGGHLVYIEHEEEWDMISDFIEAHWNATGGWWIWVGARASPPGSTSFAWGSGQAATWFPASWWQSYRPGDSPDCMAVHPVSRLPLSARSCSYNMPYVCEYNM